MTTEVKVEGLEEIRRKLARFPNKFAAAMRDTMLAALYKIWELVPPYPIAPAGVDDSGRTGTLGRSLGVSEGGHRFGKPQIFEVKQLGAGTAANFQGEFGTRVQYAPKVIGDDQRMPWASYWWNLRVVARGAIEPVLKLFQAMVDEVVRWLNTQDAL